MRRMILTATLAAAVAANLQAAGKPVRMTPLRKAAEPQPESRQVRRQRERLAQKAHRTR
jgi:thioesterase domain-containing protein